MEGNKNYSQEATVKETETTKKNIITVWKEASIYMMLDKDEKYKLTYGNTLIHDRGFETVEEAINFLSDTRNMYKIIPLIAAIVTNKIKEVK